MNRVTREISLLFFFFVDTNCNKLWFYEVKYAEARDKFLDNERDASR
jgi:hypothetical protein